jgi:hypothetical protein
MATEKKTDGKTKKRIKVDDIPQPEQTLTSEQVKRVRGGRSPVLPHVLEKLERKSRRPNRRK